MIREERYVVSPKNRLALWIVKMVCRFTTLFETKHFLIKYPLGSLSFIVGYSEVHVWTKQADTMHLIGQPHGLKASGHIHYGYPEYYPVEV